MTPTSSPPDLVDACVALASWVATNLPGAPVDQARDAREVLHALLFARFLLDEGFASIDGERGFPGDPRGVAGEQDPLAVTRAVIEAMSGHGDAHLPGGRLVASRVITPPGSFDRAASAIRELGSAGNLPQFGALVAGAGRPWEFDAGREDDQVVTPALFQDLHARFVGAAGETKSAGQVYTPREISQYLAAAAVRGWMSAREQSGGSNEGGVTPARFLDPACGCGQVLVDAADRMFALAVAAWDDVDGPADGRSIAAGLLERAIHGIDVDAVAVEVARLRLWTWFLSKTRDAQGTILLPALDGTVIAGNALLGDLPPGWDRFDVIAGNPPYVFARGYLQDSKARLVARYLDDPSCPPASITGRARQAGKVNLAGLFLMRALDLLVPGGACTMIVPNTLLRATTAEVTRKHILAHATILEVVDLEAGAFDGITASTIIISLRKNQAIVGHAVVVKQAVSDLQGGKWAEHQIEQASFHDHVASAFTIHVEPPFLRMFRAARAGAFPLKSICKAIMEGLVTRRSDGLLVKDGTHPLARKLLRGRDIDRYAIRWPPDQHVIYDPSRLHRPRPAWVHEAAVKLVAQRIGGGLYPLRVALDDAQHHAFASINAIILEDDPVVERIRYEYHYILGLLNSRFMNAYYLLHYSNKSRLTVNIGKTYLEALPVKPAPPDLQGVVGFLARCLVALHGGSDPGGDVDLATFLDRDVLDAIIFEHHVMEDAHAPGSMFDVVGRAIEGLPAGTIVARGSMLRARLQGDPAFHARAAKLLGGGLNAIHAFFN